MTSAAPAIPPQIVPGWYQVSQETVAGDGYFYEVGYVDVRDSGAGDGSSTETWYLYYETIGLRHKYRSIGAQVRDQLRFERVNLEPAQPTGIKSTKIVAACSKPVIVGP